MDPRSTSQSSSRRRSSRPQSSPSGAPLQLPTLPRFHPATYGSQGSSFATTPSSSGNSPQPQMSPRAQQRQLSDAQQQLWMYQRELLNHQNSYMGSASSYRSSMTSKPESPKLMPLAGSPGPVTPLELEGESYLAAGLNHKTILDIDKLLKEESKKKRDYSARLTSSSINSR